MQEITDFNSTIDTIKQAAMALLNPNHEANFNSTIDTIKQKHATRYSPTGLNFNSTIDTIKPFVMPSTLSLIVFLFQFYYRYN